MQRKFNITDLLFRWVAPLLVLACAVWFVYAMGAREKPKRRKPPPRKSIPVEIVHAREHDGPISIDASGVAIPHREVQLSARVGGQVVFKSDALSPGNFVRKGDILLQIDSTDYELEVARLEQEYAKANVDLKQLGIDQENTQRMIAINKEIVDLRKRGVSRLTRLRSANATSASEADIAKLDMLTSVEKMTVYDNEVRQFESQTKSMEMARDLIALQLKRAKIDLSRTKIAAPFSGVVIANMVEQDGNVASGAVIAKIEDTSAVEVRCQLRTDDIAFIQESQQASQASTQSEPPNQSRRSLSDPSTTSQPQQTAGESSANAYQLPTLPVTIEYERDGKIHSWQGVLSRQDGLGIDEMTRTMPVRIRVSRPTEDSATENPLALVRGMFVRVNIHCQTKLPMLVIPESVVRPGKKLWLTRDNQLHIEPIRITRIKNGEAFISRNSTPLSTKDQIISSPVPNARSGMAISLASDSKPGGTQGGKKKKGMPGETASAQSNVKQSSVKQSSITPSMKPKMQSDALSLEQSR